MGAADFLFLLLFIAAAGFITRRTAQAPEKPTPPVMDKRARRNG
jgi:hypothetical protein